MTKYIPFIAFGLILFSCKSKTQTQLAGPQTPSLPVIQLPAQDIEGTTSYPVRIEGIVNAEVRAKIPGYITRVLVDEGAYVRKGQPLFRLETQSLTEDAQAAKANIEAAQVGVDQLKPLVEQKIVSEVQLRTAEARLAQARASYKSIVANIDYANINSPVAGYVGRIPYRQGSLVNPTSPLPLATISNTSEVYGYFSMNEAEYVDFLQNSPGSNLSEKMKHFPPVRLQMANGEVYKHEGKIQTVTAQVDPTTGTVSFRATFPNPEHLIANGSSGTILIPKKYTHAVLIPQESTYEQQGITYVYQVLQDSTVTSRIINVADRINNLIVVKSGIEEGAEIVGQGASTLNDKQKIVPIPKPFDSLATGPKVVFQ